MAAGLAVLGLAGVAAAEEERDGPLAPYQMVRSLQLVQDRIAAGDHAALPMQSKLLEMIDERFRDTGAEDYSDPRNFEALLVYAMSGGNPSTIDGLLGILHLDERNRALGMGISAYLNGDIGNARVALASIDPLAEPPELGAFLALVKGSVTSSPAPATALKMFDQARLLSPGTLVEEAALRRTVGLARHLDGPRFLMAAGQYIRRFLYSPYASQFVDQLVAGVVILNDTIDLHELESVLAEMDPERQRVVYLRLARRAGIDGIPGLAQYASDKAKAVAVEGADPTLDPRTLLYSSMGTITSDTVEEVLPKLEAIDRSRLSDSDRKLLDAALMVANAVIERPEAPPEIAPPPVGAAPDDRAAADAGAEDGLPEAEPIGPAAPLAPAGTAQAPAPPADTAPAQAEPAPQAPAVAAEGAAASAATAEVAPAPGAGGTSTVDSGQTSAVVDDARKKLDEIDQLLKENEK